MIKRWTHNLEDIITSELTDPCSDDRKGNLSLRHLGFTLQVRSSACYYWWKLSGQLTWPSSRPFTIWRKSLWNTVWCLTCGSCVSLERSYFWCIRNVVGMLLSFFPWNVQWAHNTYSKLISLSIATIIKKMLKLHLSAQRNLWWREGGFFLNLLLCQLVWRWIGWLAEWC